MPSDKIKHELKKLKAMRNQTPAKKVLGAIATQQMRDKNRDAVIDQALLVVELMAIALQDIEEKLHEK